MRILFHDESTPVSAGKNEKRFVLDAGQHFSVDVHRNIEGVSRTLQSTVETILLGSRYLYKKRVIRDAP